MSSDSLPTAIPSATLQTSDQEEGEEEMTEHLLSMESDGSLLNVDAGEAEEWLKMKCGPFISIR